MLFTETAFFVLLFITLPLYYATAASEIQILVLIAASFAFYAWYVPALLLLLLLSIALNSLLSFMMWRAPVSSRRTYFLLAIILNLGILACFKYAGFFAHNLTFLIPAAAVAFLSAVPLPIGVSFYTFEGISLATDTFRGTYRAPPIPSWRHFPRHLRNSSLFIAFFPHLIAGPILKANQFMPQIAPKHFRNIDFDSAARALVLGYFLKSVIADNLASQTGLMSYPFYIFSSSTNLAALLFGYSCQILADFAGYSSIAIGLAYLFGYKIPANFNWPYISQSFSEFWRRWHISLSTWLRDYLYFPLGGNRYGTARTQLNLLVVMALGGLWHGASWNYLIWGLWHGGALVIERPFLGTAFYRTRNVFVAAFRILLVFTVVTFGWLLFRLPTFWDVKGYLHALLGNVHVAPNLNQAMVIAMLTLPLVLLHFAKLFKENGGTFPRAVSLLAYGSMFYFLLTSVGPSHAFIYFQF